jgi:hypothetical protein
MLRKLQAPYSLQKAFVACIQFQLPRKQLSLMLHHPFEPIVKSDGSIPFFIDPDAFDKLSYRCEGQARIVYRLVYVSFGGWIAGEMG